MKTEITACDVFISHAAADASLAEEIGNACRVSGLEPVSSGELAAGANVSDAVWEALAESRALVTVLPSTGPTPPMAIEIGAARAWNKPIFGVVRDPSFAKTSAALAGVQLYTVGRLDDAINAIKRSAAQFSEDDGSYLAEAYAELGIAVDQLALDPKQFGKLVKKFNTRAKKQVPGERLLAELLRMRKQGKLRTRTTTAGGALPKPKKAV